MKHAAINVFLLWYERLEKDNPLTVVDEGGGAQRLRPSVSSAPPPLPSPPPTRCGAGGSDRQVAGPTPIRYTREDWIPMRSSLVYRASGCQCTSCIGPGFDPSIRRHSGIWGAADEAVLNLVRKKIPQKGLNTERPMIVFLVGPTKPLPSPQWRYSAE